jgi:hypothetical protein
MKPPPVHYYRSHHHPNKGFLFSGIGPLCTTWYACPKSEYRYGDHRLFDSGKAADVLGNVGNYGYQNGQEAETAEKRRIAL